MDNEKWLEAYRTNKNKVWIKVRLTSGFEYYFWNRLEWLALKEICDENRVFVEEISLQFRSHEIVLTENLKDADAVYLVRSVKAAVGAGQDDTSHYYTVGFLKDGIMHKSKWATPELVMDSESQDPLDKCVEEAIIYDQRQARTN